MNNFEQPGLVQTFTAPSGGVVAGGVYKIGQVLVVAAASVAQTLPFEGQIRGVFRNMPKATGTAWTEGALLYWDVADGEFNTSSSGNRLAGHAAEAAESAADTGTVYLDGTSRADT